jgi:hypothetical protein
LFIEEDAKSERPFSASTDSRRPSYFLSQLFSSRSIDEAEGETGSERASRRSRATPKLSIVSKLADMVPTAEFLQVESTLKAAEAEELNDKRVLNFHKMLRIVKESVHDPVEHREIVKEMTAHQFEHFVLLLQRPHLQFLGIYLLKADLTKIEKLWGNGPRFITPADVDTCWYYNVTTKEFDCSQIRSFQSNVDAVST